ncbi:hypothetical protein QE152_g38428 [Popillia japonica]|uniref:Uncharacterized protein n=1 Tax=Popillia japonica TaxID=7064 RepID=A0AAW1HWP4_POPJA
MINFLVCGVHAERELYKRKIIFSSDWECQYKKQLLVIKKLNRTVTKLERELAEIKSLLLKVRKDKIQNEVNTKDKKIAEYTSDRDSQGRCVSNIMRESMNNYDITCIFKPNANWEFVVDSIDCLAADYGKLRQYVIVWTGLNDASYNIEGALAGVSHTNVILVTALAGVSHTNVILVTVPFLHNRPVLNSFIANINNGLGSVTETCDHVLPHLKHIGKLKVVSAVSSFIESHLSEYKDHQAGKFINFQNLIFISTVTDNDDEKISLSRVEAPGNSRSNRLTDVRSTHAKGLDKQVAVEQIAITDVRSTHAKGLDKQVAVEQIAITGAVDYNSRVETTDGAGNLREFRTDSGEESGQEFSDDSTDESDDTVIEQSESNFM